MLTTHAPYAQFMTRAMPCCMLHLPRSYHVLGSQPHTVFLGHCCADACRGTCLSMSPGDLLLCLQCMLSPGGKKGCSACLSPSESGPMLTPHTRGH
jgi:hypothetical protein